MEKKVLFSILILVLYLAVAFFRIDKIPGEWFGDISNVHEYVQEILSGKWPFYFLQSPGPVYHYLITPVVILFNNHGYETYKVASIFVGLLGLVATFLFVYEISSFTLAAITVLVTSFSFWYLTWSRLGNSQIIIPLITIAASYFFARYIRRGAILEVLMMAIIASLGWYTYPQTFILAPVFLFVYLLALLVKRKFLKKSKEILAVVFTMIILFLPFINIVRSDEGNFGPYGYIGKKVLPATALSRIDLFKTLGQNFLSTVKMLHFSGDKTFRINVPGHPHLDRVSGVMFFLGIVYFLKRRLRPWLFFGLFMLVILILPSILPAIPKAEIPSSSRTIAISPYVFMFVGAGFLGIYELLLNFVNSKINFAIASTIILVVAAFLNLEQYFTLYPNELPNRNLAIGRQIAKYLDKNIDQEVNIYFGSCCWGEWGQPEPKSIDYSLRIERSIVRSNRIVEKCDEVNHFPALIIISPGDFEKLKLNMFKECFPNAEVKDITFGSELLFRQILVPVS